jgi:hypothetical protein
VLGVWRVHDHVSVRPAPARTRARQGDAGSVVVAVCTIVLLLALVMRVGADARWLPALGHSIINDGSIPTGVPFAAAPSSGWPNPLALAELLLYGLYSALGDRGLIAAQLAAVVICFFALARDARRAGASADAVATALLLAAAGSLASLAVVRVQLFSLALFPVLVYLLREDARTRSRRIWLVVPLLALWANLHGAAILGLGVTLCYLLLSVGREEPRRALAIALASIAALWMTPAFLDTASYYDGVLGNAAAERGVGLWGRFSVGAPLDDLALAALIALAYRARRSRPSLWEWAVLAGLAVLSVGAIRSSVWMLLFLVAPAARTSQARPREWGYLARLMCAVAVAAVLFALVRGPASDGSGALVRRAVALAGGTPILASDVLAERTALDGGRIWLGNPLDAFSLHDQNIYLDWLAGVPRGDRALGPAVRVVLVGRTSDAAALMARATAYRLVASDSRTLLYLRTR